MRPLAAPARRWHPLAAWARTPAPWLPASPRRLQLSSPGCGGGEHYYFLILERGSAAQSARGLRPGLGSTGISPVPPAWLGPRRWAVHLGRRALSFPQSSRRRSHFHCHHGDPRAAHSPLWIARGPHSCAALLLRNHTSLFVPKSPKLSTSPSSRPESPTRRGPCQHLFKGAQQPTPPCLQGNLIKINEAKIDQENSPAELCLDPFLDSEDHFPGDATGI